MVLRIAQHNKAATMTRILLKSRILTFLRPPQLLASFTALRLRPKLERFPERLNRGFP